MKKIYLSALALSIGLVSFGQRSEAKKIAKTNLETVKAVNDGSEESVINSMLKKADGDTLWFEDFEDSDRVYTFVDNLNRNMFWKLHSGFLDESQYVGDEVTVFDGDPDNNFMYLPLDLYNTEIGPTSSINLDSYFQTPAINADYSNGVSVEFRQTFRRCCSITPAPETYLSVSKTADFTESTEYDIIQGAAANSTINVTTLVNISEVIGADYTGDIFLRFYVKSGSSAYYWTIDDILLTKAEDNLLRTESRTAHFDFVEYSRIPQTQTQPMGAYTIVYNNGNADQTNVQLNVTIDDGQSIVEKSTTGITIPAFMNDTIRYDSLWTPEATAGKQYTVTLDVSSDSIPSVDGANAYINSFEITEDVMALDDYNYSSTGTLGATENVELGAVYDCTQNIDLYSIETVSSASTVAGSLVNVKLYRSEVLDGERVYNELWSKNVTVASGDIETPTKTSNDDGTPIYSLVRGEVYVAAVQTFNNGTTTYALKTSGFGPETGAPNPTHAFQGYPTIGNPDALPEGGTRRYSTSNMPMIRLDFEEVEVGIEEGRAASNFSVYPNPSNGEFTINLTKEVNTAAISVRNVIGQTVFNKTVNVAGRTKETISLMDYSKGVYFLTVNDETVKLIIE
jgi:hypothetical protein